MRRAALSAVLAILFAILMPADARAKPLDEGYGTSFYGIRAGYGYCPYNDFCAWSQNNAGGYGVVFPELRGCGNRVELGGGQNDWVNSIRNRGLTWVHIQNYEGNGVWKTIWISNPNNWGNLPSNLVDKADAFVAICY